MVPPSAARTPAALQAAVWTRPKPARSSARGPGQHLGRSQPIRPRRHKLDARPGPAGDRLGAGSPRLNPVLNASSPARPRRPLTHLANSHLPALARQRHRQRRQNRRPADLRLPPTPAALRRPRRQRPCRARVSDALARADKFGFGSQCDEARRARIRHLSRRRNHRACTIH